MTLYGTANQDAECNPGINGDIMGVESEQSNLLKQKRDDKASTNELPVKESDQNTECPNKLSPDNKRLTMAIFCMMNYCEGAIYSKLAPFFPTKALSKDINITIAGFIIGVFELMIVITSPIFGRFISNIGAKRMYLGGVLVFGVSTIIFGVLVKAPDGAWFATLCVIERVLEGTGAAAFVTATLTLLAQIFQDNLTTMFGIFEMCIALGLTSGPFLGGVLYELGGYVTPFAVTGSFAILIAIASSFLLPSLPYEQTERKGSLLDMLRIPIIAIMCMYVLIGMSALGLLNVGLAENLKHNFDFTPLITGTVFMVCPALYGLSNIVMGRIVDKRPHLSKPLLVAGYLTAAFAYIFLGPASFLRIPNNLLWLVIVSLVLLGFGVGTLIIIFRVMVQAARDHGYPENLETFGMISGVFSSFLALGWVVGPVLGGFVDDRNGFPTACVTMSAMLSITACILLSYMLISKSQLNCCQAQMPPEVITLSSNKSPEQNGTMKR